jgi:twitching motility protein PilI
MNEEYFCIQLRQSTQLVLPLKRVAEVISLTWGDICPIPGVPSALLGVVNQRGQLLWVLELGDLLSDLLGLVPSPISYKKWDSLKLVVLTPHSSEGMWEVSTPQLGCVVAELKGIVNIDSSTFKPIPSSFSPTFSSFFLGMTQVERSPMALLNVSAIFSALRIVET